MQLKLKQDIPKRIHEIYDLPPEEEILYAVNHRLDLEGQVEKDAWFVATKTDFYVISHGEKKHWPLNEFTVLDAQQGVYSGYVYGERDDGSFQLLLRFAAKDRERFSYITRGLTLQRQGKPKVMHPKEREKYCEHCGRGLRGASYCVNCDGGHWQNLRRVIDLLKPFRKTMIKIAIPVLIIAVANVGQRFLERYIIDEFLIPGEGSWSTILFIFFGAAAFLGILLGAFMYRDFHLESFGYPACGKHAAGCL